MLKKTWLAVRYSVWINCTIIVVQVCASLRCLSDNCIWSELFVTFKRTDFNGKMLWNGWLESRKSIQPVKLWLMRCWDGYLSVLGAENLRMIYLMPLPLSVVKYLKYKYLKYVFKIHCMYFVFCLLTKYILYFVFQTHNFVYFVFELQFGPNSVRRPWSCEQRVDSVMCKLEFWVLTCFCYLNLKA